MRELTEYFIIVTRYRQYPVARPVILHEARMLRNRVTSSRLRVEIDRLLVSQEPAGLVG